MNFQSILDKQKQYFDSNITRDLTWRIQQLKQIKKLVIENEQALLDALQQDLGKPALEAWITELSYITGDVDHVLKHIKKWAKPVKVSTPLVVMPGKSFIKPEPQGSVLIMSAWNYPVQLAFAPLIAVISAGNCAVIKPSEVSPAVSNIIAKLVPQYLDNNAFSVVEGAVAETTALLELPFNHIMYTGNGMVGKIVMTAAAKHLTPVTLELGGKSPVFVDHSCNLEISAQRLAWGKWINAGQTCIAPDYILTTKDMVEPLVKALKAQIKAMFGDDPKQSSSYGRIVNQRHTERLSQYLDSGEIVHGGSFDIENKYFEPTIIVNPELDSKVMTDEIFGAIFPIITVDNYQSAKQLIISREKPLAAYIFTKDKAQQQDWVNTISSGSQCINDVIMFNGVPDLPFGGTGPSGMGQYSGKSGFDNFSNSKAVLKRPFLKDLPVRFAPYTNFKFNLLRKIR
ncbi:aldehyde dehydrogenase family protein [Thalassomonas sp. M1454]|uniref:aldehyde dehydrogenase family protein n=1 Tax=Thalassomonas sp. M1454 TaxID=2594477 RepID=UPI00117E7699|nr:aldehyde dehydrogenase family protein [Thalassomonas sp. M1454]TRX57269.1 aldehyde dehydrogenase family protein [Thalassomonas sp. M1454]